MEYQGTKTNVERKKKQNKDSKTAVCQYYSNSNEPLHTQPTRLSSTFDTQNFGSFLKAFLRLSKNPWEIFGVPSPWQHTKSVPHEDPRLLQLSSHDELWAPHSHNPIEYVSINKSNVTIHHCSTSTDRVLQIWYDSNIIAKYTCFKAGMFISSKFYPLFIYYLKIRFIMRKQLICFVFVSQSTHDSYVHHIQEALHVCKLNYDTIFMI